MAPKIYKIHDNGGRPFVVNVSGSEVSVSKNMDSFEKVNGKWMDIKRPEKMLFTIVADQIHIGKKSPKGGYDGMKSSEAEGNSILLHVGSVYRYIGSEIYDFKPIDGEKIIKYYSDIGNNDVPYPYALSNNYVYFMIEKTIVPLEEFDMKKNLYGQYYEKSNKTFAEFDPVFVKKIKKMKVKVVEKRNI